MTITHHPTDATLAAFAGGTLDEGRSLVVATHVAGCPACREGVRRFECVGGVLLEDVESTPLRPDALPRLLERLRPSQEPGLAAQSESEVVGIDLAAPLERYALGPWRRIGLGVHWRSVAVPPEEGTRVFMLRADPGTRLPHHRHTGTEWTCLIAGAFRHDGGRYGAGDFDEADDTIEHRPVVEDEGPCVCLVALQGSIAFQGWLGRLIQPFVRI